MILSFKVCWDIFVTQNIVEFVKYFIYIEENVNSFLLGTLDQFVNCIVQIFYSLSKICLLALSATYISILKSSYYDYNLDPFLILLIYAFYILNVCLWIHIHLKLLYFLGIDPFIVRKTPSLSLIMLLVSKSIHLILIKQLFSHVYFNLCPYV